MLCLCVCLRSLLCVHPTPARHDATSTSLPSCPFNPTHLQGFSTAKHRPTVQRIIVANRAAAQEVPQPLHDSYSEIDYTPRYKK